MQVLGRIGKNYEVDLILKDLDLNLLKNTFQQK